MPAVYDAIDLEFGWNGDFALGDTGDLKDTSEDALLSLLDQIHSICASVFRDWEIYPNRAAGVDDFIGEPNTESSGKRLRDRIHLSIVAAELVTDEDLEVRVLPVHIYQVLVVIKIYALATAFNNLRPGEVLQTTLVFDTLEQEVFFLYKTPMLIKQY